MSKHKHNYSQYSNKKYESSTKENPTTVVNPVKPEVKPVIVNETVNTVKLPETVDGMVVNCAKLNVREKATVDSDIVCVLNAQSEIQIDVNRSNTNWVYVYTATGLEGYCMRQYIEAHL